MILEEKTKQIFGYYSDTLKKHSTKKIYFLCEDCNKEMISNYGNYSIKKYPNKCKECAIRAVHAYNINENYFDGKNLQSFYWAGFLFADATLYPKTNRIAFELSKKDISVVEALKEDLSFGGPIITRKRLIKWIDGKYINKVYTTSSINFTGKKIYNSLANYGVTGNKSQIFIPSHVLNLNHKEFNIEYAKAFLIGLISGDGSISQHSDTEKLLEITQYGNYSVCNWAKNLMEFLIFPELSEAQIHPNRKNLFKYTMTSKRAITLFKILNKVNIKKLKRKWNNSVLIENFDLLGE